MGGGERRGPGVGLRATVGERRQRLADPLLAGEVEVGGDEALAVGSGGEDDTPGVDDRRATVRVEVRRSLADLAGSEDEDGVLDRPGAEEDFPMVAAGDGGEGGGNGDQAGTADGEDPVQLGEAKVVTDGKSGDQVADRRGDDLLARLLVG